MGKRNFRFFNYSTGIKAWKFFEAFYLIPTLETSCINTYSYGKPYLFTRSIGFCWLWFYVGIQWDYGKVSTE